MADVKEIRLLVALDIFKQLKTGESIFLADCIWRDIYGCAIEALEKQVPKKTKGFDDKHHSSYCPDCETEFYQIIKYCPNCRVKMKGYE